MSLLLPDLLTTWLQFSPSVVALLNADGNVTLASQSTYALLGVTPEELLGRPFLPFFAPDQQAQLAQSWADPNSRSDFYPTQVIRKDGSVAEVDARHFQLPFDGKSYTSIVLVDVTEERRILRKLSSLSQFASSLTYAGSLESTLDGICEKVVDNTAAVGCSVVLLEESTGKLVIGGGYGLPREHRNLAEYALNCGLQMASRRAVDTGEMVIERDITERMGKDPTWCQLIQPLREANNKMPNWNSVVSVPIHFAGKRLGALTGYYAHQGQLSGAETTFLQTLTDLAAVAIENARLVIESEEKAALEERQRLARELHDSVAQALYGIGLGLKTAQVHVRRDPARAVEPLEYCQNLVDGASKEMQALIFALRPEALEQEGLIRSLERQVESLRSRHSLQVHFHNVPEPPLEGGTRHALFRVATEAFHNIVKHSRARKVSLEISQENGTCRMRIHDDGIGFDANAEYPGHLGLRSMRERIQAVGGTWSLESQRCSGGTTLQAEVRCR